MFEKLTFDEFVGLAETATRVSVFREIPGDCITPISAFIALGGETRGAVLLESSMTGRLGRYSFLHMNPYFELKSVHGQTSIVEDGLIRACNGDPFETLKSLQRSDKVAFSHDLSRYNGGLTGFVGYDSVRFFEDIPDRHGPDGDIPEIMFRRFRDCIVFDHQTRKVIVTSVAVVGDDVTAAFETSMARLEYISGLILAESHDAVADNKILSNVKAVDEDGGLKGVQEDELSDAQFEDLVNQAKDFIHRGDVFQVVLSRSFRMKCSASPFEIYRALRLVSPAPYMFYIDAGDFVIAGASPEKQISLDGNKIEICPLAGTRLRGSRPDSEVEADLLGDPKERAEHMMLVDLARNDLGIVSEAGSVRVEELMQVHKFSHVLHLSSSVTGTLVNGKDAFDILRSSFPAGTLSGAPKIRAMEIIDQLEPSRRGLYGGAVCSIDSDGNLNSCIAIRMAVMRDGIATVRAGAGIVADSDPAEEAAETRHKAKSVMEAIALAQGGI